MLISRRHFLSGFASLGALAACLYQPMQRKENVSSSSVHLVDGTRPFVWIQIDYIFLHWEVDESWSGF